MSISIISQPDQWESLYDEISYSLKNVIRAFAGNYPTSNSTLFPGCIEITCDNTDLFSIGDFVEGVITSPGITINLFNGKVVGFNGKKVVITRNILTPVFTANRIYVAKAGSLNFRLYAGYRQGHLFGADKPLSLIAEFKSSSAPDYSHLVRLHGYLQSYIQEVAPPVIGSDPSLFLHYQLKCSMDDSGVYFNVDGIKYAANSTLVAIGTSPHVTNRKALFETSPIRLSGEGFIESFIIDESIRNRLYQPATGGSNGYVNPGYVNDGYVN